MQEDSEKWDDKNEDSRVTAQGAQDYTYGYNAGCAEAFRASAVRVEQFAATHLASQAEPSEAIRSVAYGYMPGMGGKMLADSIQNFINAERERISALLVGKGEK